MEVNIKIDCDNAAFQPQAGKELARILRELAGKVEGTTLLETDSVALLDESGNDVGKLTVQGRKLADNAHGVEYQPAGGTEQEMLDKLYKGITLTVQGFVRIWAEPGEICVHAHEDEDVDPDYYPLSIAGLSRALQAVGYDGSEGENEDTAHELGGEG